MRFRTGWRAVRAARPTARPAHASAHLIDADFDAALPCLFLLGGRDPTDPLIPRERGDLSPKALHGGIGYDRSAKIGWQPMERAAREVCISHNQDSHFDVQFEVIVLNRSGNAQ